MGISCSRSWSNCKTLYTHKTILSEHHENIFFEDNDCLEPKNESKIHSLTFK